MLRRRLGEAKMTERQLAEAIGADDYAMVTITYTVSSLPAKVELLVGGSDVGRFVDVLRLVLGSGISLDSRLTPLLGGLTPLLEEVEVGEFLLWCPVFHGSEDGLKFHHGGEGEGIIAL